MLPTSTQLDILIYCTLIVWYLTIKSPLGLHQVILMPRWKYWGNYFLYYCCNGKLFRTVL